MTETFEIYNWHGDQCHDLIMAYADAENFTRNDKVRYIAPLDCLWDFVEYVTYNLGYWASVTQNENGYLVCVSKSKFTQR